MNKYSILLLSLLAIPYNVMAEDQTPIPAGGQNLAEQSNETGDYKDDLFGSWGGVRTKLKHYGVDVSASETFDVFANVSGGLKRSARAMSYTALNVELDGKKLTGTEGLTGVFSFFYNNGGRPDADLVGSAQGFDNTETDFNSGILYQAYLEQQLFGGKASILAGIYEVNNEFYVTDSSTLFLNSTFGLGTELAAGGRNGPSTYPYTSLGTRLKVNPGNDIYLLAGIFDGVPGNPNDPNANPVGLHSHDGELIIGDAGINPGNLKIGVGAWKFTEDKDHFTEIDSSGNAVRKADEGFYVMGEKEILHQGEDRGITAFARFGTADGAVDQFSYAWSGGFTYKGVIQDREDSELGLGMTQAHNSRQFKEAAIIAGAPVDDNETTLELIYSDKPLPWLTLKPDVQYIINPGTTSGEHNATVIGIRGNIDL